MSIPPVPAAPPMRPRPIETQHHLELWDTGDGEDSSWTRQHVRADSPRGLSVLRGIVQQCPQLSSRLKIFRVRTQIFREEVQ